MTREERIAQLSSQIEQAKNELEFLNDSGVFYELNLGTTRKTILIPDLSDGDGIKRTAANDAEKLPSSWYKNYAGFTSDQESKAIATSKRLVAYMKLQRIHEYLYPNGLDKDATGDDIFKWVISYDADTDTFVPKNVGASDGTDEGALAPENYEALFYFKGTPANTITESADAEQAISLMKDSDDGSDQSLRDLFNNIL